MFLDLEKWDQGEICLMFFLYDLSHENLKGDTSQKFQALTKLCFMALNSSFLTKLAGEIVETISCNK